MKILFTYRSFLFFWVFFISINAFAQHKRYKPKNRFHSRHLNYINNIRVTGMLGLSSYYGDLCDQTVCFKYRPGITIGGYYRYNGRLSFRGDLTYLRLSGSDAGGDNAKRNLSFRSPNFELAAGVMYDMMYFERNWHLRAKYTPYLFAQVGLLYYDPKAKAQSDGKWHSLRSLQTEGVSYSPITVSVPFGAGIRYKINSYMDISFEFAYRKTFTDYLDDISTTFKDNSSFTDPIAAELADRTFEGGYTLSDSDDGMHWNDGHKRGNPSRKDGFFMFGFKFEYMIKTTEQTHNINSMPRFRHKNPGMHRKIR